LPYVNKVQMALPRQKIILKYDDQDQQGKTAFNERNPHTTKQQELATKSPGGI
jgi:hypothetical protein